MVTTIIKYQCTKPGRYDCLNGQGVNDIIQSTNVNIFPNPINHQGSLSINIDKPATVTVSITDMLGNIIMADKKLYTESGEYNYLIDGSTIPGGTYFATIVIDGVPISRKIVVVH